MQRQQNILLVLCSALQLLLRRADCWIAGDSLSFFGVEFFFALSSLSISFKSWGILSFFVAAFFAGLLAFSISEFLYFLRCFYLCTFDQAAGSSMLPSQTRKRSSLIKFGCVGFYGDLYFHFHNSSFFLLYWPTTTLVHILFRKT